MNRLLLQAGPAAYKLIKKEGFSPDMLSGVAAAAGGPKWFTTYGLMRYILTDFVNQISHPLDFIGSSVGAWQVTAALTTDPGAAIDRLQRAYCNSLYTEQPDESEISLKCAEIIRAMISDETHNILDHAHRNLHIIAARGKGLLGHKSKLLKGLGFGFTYLTNALSREGLRYTAERIVFNNGADVPFDVNTDVLPTIQISLQEENLLPALRASGSIPFMMEGIDNITGAPTGTYWDGGLTDYHMALPYDVSGIMLLPHFLPSVMPGWFDKKLPWSRYASSEMMSNVLLVSPSKEYVLSLPRKQISDMRDFYFFGKDQQARIKYWQAISERSISLGEEFDHLIKSGKLVDQLIEYQP